MLYDSLLRSKVSISFTVFPDDGVIATTTHLALDVTTRVELPGFITQNKSVRAGEVDPQLGWVYLMATW